MKSKRLQKIIKENIKFEKETPYNFCDRWCERCCVKKQLRCKLYQDEIERKMACIAHGREPDDPEITEKVIEEQYKAMEKFLEEHLEESEIDFDNTNNPEFEKIEEHIEVVKTNPLDATAEQYRKKAHTFLEKTFYGKEKRNPELFYDFETICWYHTLLSVKLHRALCGFHEPATEYDISLHDAVAQFAICKKAISESVKALQKIKSYHLEQKNLIVELLALLHNLLSRIEVMEEDI